MTARRALGVTLAAILLGLAAFLFLRREPAPALAPASSAPVTKASPASAPSAAPVIENRNSKIVNRKPAAESPIADELNAPSGTIAADLRILQELFLAFNTNFPRLGNPVGENFEITAALLGDNPAQFAFIGTSHRALNAQGELCDRWGTPFRFHQLSGTQMEVRSAGPDRKFGTADDAILTP